MVSNIFKRYTAIVAVTVVVLVLSGCENGIPSSSKNTSSDISATSAVSILENESSSSSELMSDIEKPENKEVGLSPVYIQSEYISPFGSLVYCSDFATPEDIPGYMLLNWYREHINSTKEPSEIKNLYTKNGIDGYIYPSIDFEDYVMQYFDLSSEYMQNNPTFEYNSTHDGYVIIGGGRGEKVELQLDDTASISEKGDIIVIQAQLINSENTSKGVKELKIQTMPNGSFKFLSYISLE